MISFAKVTSFPRRFILVLGAGAGVADAVLMHRGRDQGDAPRAGGQPRQTRQPATPGQRGLQHQK
ncbi:unnamed protein product, partial [Amoebophrya sp. A25]|eukprot:GSA25T00005922001.1